MSAYPAMGSHAETRPSESRESARCRHHGSGGTVSRPIHLMDRERDGKQVCLWCRKLLMETNRHGKLPAGLVEEYATGGPSFGLAPGYQTGTHFCDEDPWRSSVADDDPLLDLVAMPDEETTARKQAESEIGRLADWLLAHAGEEIQNESACDMAIRLLEESRATHTGRSEGNP